MARIKLISDSACDLTPQQEQECDVLILNFKVAVGDDSYTSRVDFDNGGFYKILEDYDGLPSTSQITAFEFEETFERLYNEGWEAAVFLSINKNGSSTYNNALMAKESFFEQHGDVNFKIEVIDSRSYTCAYGYPLVCAAEMIKKNYSFESVCEYIKDWVENAEIYFAPYSLKYAKKSGRIPSAAAFVGEMLGLKPIMKIYDGAITTYDKVRGDKAVIPKIIEHSLASMEPGTPYCAIYGSDETICDELVESCTNAFGYPPAFSTQIGAAIAINAGPVVAGVMFRKKKDE